LVLLLAALDAVGALRYCPLEVGQVVRHAAAL
jgi:hypothetical protein